MQQQRCKLCMLVALGTVFGVMLCLPFLRINGSSMNLSRTDMPPKKHFRLLIKSTANSQNVIQAEGGEQRLHGIQLPIDSTISAKDLHKAAFKSPTGRSTIAMVYSNHAYRDFVGQNLCYLHSAGIPRAVVLALDDALCDADYPGNLAEYAICLKMPKELQVSAEDSPWSFGVDSDYHELLVRKIQIVRELLEVGLDVLMLDADAIVQKRDFWSYIKPDVQLAVTWDGDPPGVGRPDDWICAGLMLIRHHKSSSAFFEEVLRLMREWPMHDQDAMQLILTDHYQSGFEFDKATTGYRNATAMGLRWQLMDRWKFLQGSLVWEIKHPGTIFSEYNMSADFHDYQSLHFNRHGSVETKITIAKELGLWRHECESTETTKTRLTNITRGAVFPEVPHRHMDTFAFKFEKNAS